jgi:hypothetical protein
MVFGDISHQKPSGSSSTFQNKTPKIHSGLFENIVKSPLYLVGKF